MPFFLEEGQSTFTLEGDRTSDYVAGMLLRLGATPFYFKELVYDAGTNLTTVTVWPTPAKEAGSRAPGNDVLSLITTDPVTDETEYLWLTDSDTGCQLETEFTANDFASITISFADSPWTAANGASASKAAVG